MLDKLKFMFREFLLACWDVIKLPFWMIKVGWRKLMSFGSRRIVLVVVAAVIVTAVALTGFVEMTSQPGFCKSCHVMEPYFKAWETSSHNHITCTECHIQPGLRGTVHAKFTALSMVANYATGVYKRSKPWAEVEDAACLREGCHESRLLASTEKFHGVVFDHKPHLEKPRRDRQLRCTSCHAQIVQGEHITVTETTCFLCHFKPDTTGKWSDLARCTHCHNPPQGAAAADTSFDHTNVLARKVECTSCHATNVVGDGFVSKDRCNSCHAEKAHIEKYSDRDFVHHKHVTEHKVECTQCHTAIRHGKEAVQEASTTRECSKCHGGADNAVEAVWSGKVPGIKPTPSKMARAGMECESCHTGEIHREIGKSPAPTCTPCHDAEYSQLWPRWKPPIERSIDDLTTKAKLLAEPLRTNMLNALRIYREGNPLHNPDLVKAIAEQIEGSAHEHEIGSCASCHPAAGATLVMHGGRTFDHRKHVVGDTKCETCHEPGNANHGKLRLTDSQCNNCHHREIKTDNTSCAKCHSAQVNTFTGKLLSGTGPAVMADGGVNCVDCHVFDNKQTAPSADIVQACVGCHDQSYGDSLQAWWTGGDALITRLDHQIKTLRPGTELYERYAKIASAYRADGSHSVHHPELFRRWVEQATATP
jgi:nitrate/TMAO reductase-like tetraheme cytochrome c subunit